MVYKPDYGRQVQEIISVIAPFISILVALIGIAGVLISSRMSAKNEAARLAVSYQREDRRYRREELIDAYGSALTLIDEFMSVHLQVNATLHRLAEARLALEDPNSGEAELRRLSIIQDELVDHRREHMRLFAATQSSFTSVELLAQPECHGAFRAYMQVILDDVDNTEAMLSGEQSVVHQSRVKLMDMLKKSLNDGLAPATAI